jgi:AraC family transcriptional regulator
MPATGLITLDPVTKRPIRVFEDRNVLWSSGRSHWDGLTVERHVINGIDTPEFQIPDHALAIQLSPEIKIEERVRGKYRARTSRRGNIWLYSAGAPRQGRTSHEFDVLLIAISKTAIAHATGDEHSAQKLELIENRELHDRQIEHIALALKEEVESGYMSGRIYGESLCTALSAHLVALYSTSKEKLGTQTGGMSPASLRRVLDHVNENLASDLRLSDIAEIAGLSQYRFCHNFKQSTGLAPHQYIIQQRMELAKQLLRETRSPVITIAYAVGCSTPSRFSMLFRQTTGSTPSSYRASFS